MIKSSILQSKMADQEIMKIFSSLTTLLTAIILLALQLMVIPPVISHADETAPNSPFASTLESWIGQNIKEHLERKANIAHGFNLTVLDQLLVKAEEGGRVKVIKVKKNGGGDFDNVTAAVDSVPLENKQRVVIWIGGGEYFEKILINRTKDFVTFYGEPTDMPKIVFNGTAAEFGTLNSATVAVESDYFVAANIAFVVTVSFIYNKFSHYIIMTSSVIYKVSSVVLIKHMHNGIVP